MKKFTCKIEIEAYRINTLSNYLLFGFYSKNLVKTRKEKMRNALEGQQSVKSNCSPFALFEISAAYFYEQMPPL